MATVYSRVGASYRRPSASLNQLFSLVVSEDGQSDPQRDALLVLFLFLLFPMNSLQHETSKQ